MSHNYVDQWQRDLGHVISHKFSAHNWCADCIVAKISINCYISLNPRAMDHFDGQQIGASWGGALPLDQWPVRLCQACCRLVVAKSFFYLFWVFLWPLFMFLFWFLFLFLFLFCSCSSSCSSSWLPSLNDAVTSTLPRCPRPRPCCRSEVLSQGEAWGVPIVPIGDKCKAKQLITFLL